MFKKPNKPVTVPNVFPNPNGLCEDLGIEICLLIYPSIGGVRRWFSGSRLPANDLVEGFTSYELQFSPQSLSPPRSGRTTHKQAGRFGVGVNLIHVKNVRVARR